MISPRLHLIANRIAFWVLAVAIAGAPLPYGSRDPAVVAFWCGLLGIGLIAAPLRNLRIIHALVLGGIGAVVAGYAIVLHEQLSPTPWIATFHPVWAEAEKLLNHPVQPSVSVVRNEPFFALGAPLANILVLVLGLLVGIDRADARRLLQIAAWAGVVYAIYGLYGLIFDPHTILGREKTAYIGNLTGTFINRNTAATYFGSVSILWFLFLLEEVRKRLPTGPIPSAELLHQVTEDRDHQRTLLVPFSMLFLCLVATFLTVSRAGSTLTVLLLAVTFVIFFRRRLEGRSTKVIAVAASAAVALVVLQLLGGSVGSRFEVHGLSDAGRIATWQSTLRIIADNPWFGTGLGTFAWAYPAYRSADVSMWGVWAMAHSTPLELASEVGVPLASLVGLAWLGALSLLLWGALHRRRDRIIPLAGFGVALLALLHSTIDFSLQISGYAIVAFGIVGIGLGQAMRDPNGGHRAQGKGSGAEAGR
ncbi:ligase [Rhodoplanes elegans]|uniref:Ligase n=1 Tax=Rhodoplanes elegans TaxID=29408 RepID=A0A327KX61_9BRAD|nr:O-antigen ligase family protein [Rhodoplanes elegans]MBK5960234.1 ligase [Rhodoplanes elegans]RAI42263.1 ligase [Rhodoplanes elegans]